MPQTNPVPSPGAAVHAAIAGPVVMIGFGSIGRGTLPLIDRHLGFDRARAVVIEPNGHDRGIVEQYGFALIETAVTADNYRELLTPLLTAGEGQGFCGEGGAAQAPGRAVAALAAPGAPQPACGSRTPATG